MVNNWKLFPMKNHASDWEAKWLYNISLSSCTEYKTFTITIWKGFKQYRKIDLKIKNLCHFHSTSTVTAFHRSYAFEIRGILWRGCTIACCVLRGWNIFRVLCVIPVNFELCDSWLCPQDISLELEKKIEKVMNSLLQSMMNLQKKF